MWHKYEDCDNWGLIVWASPYKPFRILVLWSLSTRITAASLLSSTMLKIQERSRCLGMLWHHTMLEAELQGDAFHFQLNDFPDQIQSEMCSSQPFSFHLFTSLRFPVCLWCFSQAEVAIASDEQAMDRWHHNSTLCNPPQDVIILALIGHSWSSWNLLTSNWTFHQPFNLDNPQNGPFGLSFPECRIRFWHLLNQLESYKANHKWTSYCEVLSKKTYILSSTSFKMIMVPQLLWIQLILSVTDKTFG